VAHDVTLFRDSVRERLNELAAYFMSRGVSDAATAQRKAIVALASHRILVVDPFIKSNLAF
jgi:MFS transporter, DHA2 family, multidrug resistance protein